MLHPKKVGSLPVEGKDEVKRTNEIKTAAPLLDPIDIEGKVISADALLTQTKFAEYLVEERNAHYNFIAKNNQPTLLEDISLYFKDRKDPDFVQHDPPDHGRIEVRKIWTTTELNQYLNFPHVSQAFVIQRETTNKKTGKFTAYQARHPSKQTPNVYFPLTAAIGPSKTRVIISSIGIMTKIEVEYDPAMALKTSPDCVDSQLASLNQKVFAVLHRKCVSSPKTCGLSSTISE